MSKYDGEIRAAEESGAELNDVLAALGRVPRVAVNRQDAMARLLAGGEGWRDACTTLGGAFARHAKGVGLIDGSES